MVAYACLQSLYEEKALFQLRLRDRLTRLADCNFYVWSLRLQVGEGVGLIPRAYSLAILGFGV